MRPTRLLIADDHTLVRQGLRQLCEGLGGFVVVAEAEDGAQAVALSYTAQPDVILMDIGMPVWTAWRPFTRFWVRTLRPGSSC